ncbi:hypothetical protein Tco_0951448 [Tanacetum coccineum]|uniref:Uncharacterized protein n=1 Tax=Tanacetum coccineum TaxID=301880 RepID=A0ABQ5DWV8_9ASTR
MSESTIDNYKGKQIAMEKEPNDEWENPTYEYNLILGNYVKKWLSNEPIWKQIFKKRSKKKAKGKQIQARSGKDKVKSQAK